jgi:tetratricopeptide (TPR) repeat protein
MMPESPLSRFWEMVKPPPPVHRTALSPQLLALRRRQRKLVMITLGVVVIAAAGYGVLTYIGNAPLRADKEFQEGMRMMRPDKYQDAIVHFTRALDISGQRADAYLQRGNAHRALAEPDAALADFQAAADLNPNLAEAHNGLALMYIERRDPRHAMEELNKSLVVQPTIDAYYQRGELLEAQGEHQKAIADYDQAIALARDAPYMYRARAMAKEKLGDHEGARADRMHATEIEQP